MMRGAFVCCNGLLGVTSLTAGDALTAMTGDSPRFHSSRRRLSGTPRAFELKDEERQLSYRGEHFRWRGVRKRRRRDRRRTRACARTSSA
jgi:hypothetical protein